MCSMCLSTPCNPRCPNAPEPVPVLECVMCHEGIIDGEEYLETEKGPMCRDCIEELSVTDFMELVGAEFSTARKEK